MAEGRYTRGNEMATRAGSTLTSYQRFAANLTLIVDYGNTPFLCLVDAPDRAGIGRNICDGTGWDDGCPMSEGLWRKFADWAMDFDRTLFYSDDFDSSGWDWAAFHEHGIQLTHRLKVEVGNAYSVICQKPGEDPNGRMDERTEVMPDRTLSGLGSQA